MSRNSSLKKIDKKNMVTEDYVSFETAKLLKEKGFENDAISCINVFKGHIHKIQDRLIHADDDVTIPTLQMAMKWLREVHNIFIQVELYSKYDNYCFELFQNTYRLIIEHREVYNSYEETAEAAIKYCLENLI